MDALICWGNTGRFWKFRSGLGEQNFLLHTLSSAKLTINHDISAAPPSLLLGRSGISVIFACPGKTVRVEGWKICQYPSEASKISFKKFQDFLLFLSNLLLSAV